jgi:pimeloyl-ACP methyl ester carboxylesterase
MATNANPSNPVLSVQSKDGTTIAYERVGSGPNLIMVAGALGAKDMSFTRRFVATLSKHFTLINYDRRGRGDSTDTKPFSVEREIEDIQALIQANGPSHVFGMSSGAALVLEAAASGVPMLSAIPFEPPYMVGEHRKPAHAEYEPTVKRLIAQGKRDDALKLFMRTVGVPGPMLAVMRILPMWKKLRSTADTLPYDAAAMNGFEPPAKRLGAIHVPTLLVYGDKTPKALQDGTTAVSKLVPGAELRSLPKQSHNLKPEAIAPVLVEFTSKHQLPAGAKGSSRPLVTAAARTRSS